VPTRRTPIIRHAQRFTITNAAVALFTGATALAESSQAETFESEGGRRRELYDSNSRWRTNSLSNHGTSPRLRSRSTLCHPTGWRHATSHHSCTRSNCVASLSPLVRRCPKSTTIAAMVEPRIVIVVLTTFAVVVIILTAAVLQFM
jgi:hypothetical protein